MKKEADERFVLVLSDANLDRYGISPEAMTAALTPPPSGDDVETHAFLILIAGLGDQAAALAAAMPPGKAFVCLDTKDLPKIIKQIFQSTMLK